MDISYKKNDNTNLFSKFNSSDYLNVSSVQNFIPIYTKFFHLTSQNVALMNLNQYYSLVDLVSKENDNIYEGIVTDINGIKSKKKLFFKFSPLMDTLKYITGKYDLSNSNLLNLPSICETSKFHPKMKDPNNAAYVDSFFTYLTSQMLHYHKFINGIDFYGSFLGTKKELFIDIEDDLEYLYGSTFFHKNLDQLFEMDSNFQSELMNYDTRNYKQPLTVADKEENISLIDIIDSDNTSPETASEEITELLEMKMDENGDELVLNTENLEKMNNHSINTSDDNNSIETRNERSDSVCSSRSSDTNNSEHTSGEIEDEYSSLSDESTYLKIYDFPVQIIALEKCNETMDDTLMNDEICEKKLTSFIMQILFTLITYQDKFGLTHNDLHTNNIMYVKTDKEYLYYKYSNIIYKVPTYGKIVKIIDFGRAIYKFRGQTICSDSYHHEGDAATQYNCEPYFNENKQRIEPNFSFDLCRLGCAMYDVLKEEFGETPPEIVKIINQWCLDDKGRNILYKRNGEERYPEFKLYKMIARTVHNHVPSQVIRNEYFSTYRISKKKMKGHHIINIDNIPNYQ